MPHSIFFHGGYAIHGTYETAALGRPASHGCVRISPAHAAKLYSLVRAEGATISISGSPPPSQPFASETHRHQRTTTIMRKAIRAIAIARSCPTRRRITTIAIERIFGAILGESGSGRVVADAARRSAA